MGIIANSSYALRNMGNYSQVTNMIWISGICGTTQSENIISPPNNDK
jgi:enamine deaminase RidA (YjgF/YER057c/UK114 family)